MSIKLREVEKLPTTDSEVVTILGLDIPVKGSLPLGAQVKWTDLLSKYENNEIGAVEFMLESFCLYTWRLPQHERVKYSWLSQQNLHPDDISELMAGVAKLQQAMMPTEDVKTQGKTKRVKEAN